MCVDSRKFALFDVTPLKSFPGNYYPTIFIKSSFDVLENASKSFSV